MRRQSRPELSEVVRYARDWRSSGVGCRCRRCRSRSGIATIGDVSWHTRERCHLSKVTQVPRKKWSRPNLHVSWGLFTGLGEVGTNVTSRHLSRSVMVIEAGAAHYTATVSSDAPEASCGLTPIGLACQCPVVQAASEKAGNVPRDLHLHGLAACKLGNAVWRHPE